MDNNDVLKHIYTNLMSMIRFVAILIIVSIAIVVFVVSVRSDHRMEESHKAISNNVREYISDEFTQHIAEQISNELDKRTIVKEEIVEKKVEVPVCTKYGMEASNITSIQLSIEPILQNPELPTGCEITSLAMVLQYYGFENVDKVELADKYLFKVDAETNDTYLPSEAFIGDPKSKNGYGCYNRVIVNAFDNFFYDYPNHDDWLLCAVDMYGEPLEQLENYVVNGMPVIIWASIGMKETYESTKWNICGDEIAWRANEHCLVLIGFDEENYIFADPLEGIVSYKKSLVEKRYKEMGRQAVIIY